LCPLEPLGLWASRTCNRCTLNALRKDGAPLFRGVARKLRLSVWRRGESNLSGPWMTKRDAFAVAGSVSLGYGCFLQKFTMLASMVSMNFC
jgi:hypothetical protein